ncbi:hypothetical protein TDB9533_00349 [Thalassocella blandensis]|nr:hypothetical protein TDB9533_00349 [Thalassocella blandensis]
MFSSLHHLEFKDPSITTASCMALETLLNKALQYDPATRKKLRALQHLWIHIETQKPDLHLYFSVVDENFVLRAHMEDLDSANVDAKISGDFLDFVRLSNQQYSLSNSTLHVSGKSGVLTELQNIFSELDIDWEQALCKVFGIVPGHLLAGALRKAGSTLHQAKRSIEFHLADYLSEELRSIPSRPELEYFYQDVDDVNAQTNRIEARFKQLNKLINNT